MAEAKVEQAGAAMLELSAEQKKAEAAMASLAAEARGPLLKAFSQQQSTMAKINTAFQANRKEIAALGAEMGRVGVPTREMVETYNKLLRASNEISAEYAQQKAALGSMRAALREGVTDVNQLNAVYTRFAATLNSSAGSLSRVRGIQASAAAANAQLAASAERAAAANAKNARENDKNAGTAGRAASATDRFSQAVRSLYGESRTAMSWTQRLRGEVLSLIAAYSGIYGVINILGQVIDKYQMLEAATSRLNVVMGGDESKTAEELDFIRRTSERLGIEFGSLAQEYSKFAVATKGTNLEGANTRKIFVAVAESARVNKVSMEEMAGTFVALTQIVSKGSVQMEELRQQLGDRLPGALQIMADGLGVTTEKLIEMTANGEVSSDALIGFADELTKRFGPQLANSLNTVSANMGFLQNTVTATLLAFGEAGFMDSFNELLIQLNATLRSSDFGAFLSRLSEGVASLVDLLAVLIENWRILAAAFTAIIAIRMIPFVMGVVSALKLMAFNAKMSALSFVAVQSGMASIIPAAGAATGAVTGLGVAIRGLLASTGIGLLVTVAATAFTLMATGADNASEAMEAHRKTIDAVKNAYEAADKGNSDWADRIDGATTTDLRMALEKNERARVDSLNKLRSYLMDDNPIYQIMSAFDDKAKTEVTALRNLIYLLDKSEIEIIDFRAAVSAIAEETENNRIRQMAEDILQSSVEAGKFTRQSAELEAALRVVNETATEADRVLLGMADAAETASDAFDPSKVLAYNAALREMADFIPGLKDSLQFADDLKAIDDAYMAAQANASSTSDRVRAAGGRDNARAAVFEERDRAIFEEIAKNTGVTPEIFALIAREEEGGTFKSQAYDDGYGTPTIGYGSTRIRGRAVQMGDTIGQEEAMREAVREMASLVAFIENAVKVPLSKAQMEALVSYAYNAGPASLKRDGILQPLNRGDYAGAENAIRNGVDTSKGVFSRGLRARREREADLFASGSDDPEIVAQQLIQREQQIQAEQDFRAELQATAEQQQFMIDIAKQDIIERETQKALREAELAARAAGTTLTEAEIQGIKERTAAQYAEQAQQEAEAKVKKDREAIEERVNQLLAQRGELEAQLEIYRERGDNEAMLRTQEQITAVNSELMVAIENAKAMWAAIGGAEADVGIAKMNTAALQAQQLGNSANAVQSQWKQVGQMFASGLTNAFMTFAQAVANGEDAMTAARDAFLKFAADFLIKIAEMIIQQAILNALSGIFGGGGGGGGIGGIFSSIFGTGHTGGVVGSKRIGSGNTTRQLNPAIFSAAPRFHEGGFPGLRPGEVPAVLLEGEEVLSKSDARNALNGGTGGGAERAPSGNNVKIVNMIDAGDVISQGLGTRQGEESFLNIIKANRTAIKQIVS